MRPRLRLPGRTVREAVVVRQRRLRRVRKLRHLPGGLQVRRLGLLPECVLPAAVRRQDLWRGRLRRQLWSHLRSGAAVRQRKLQSGVRRSGLRPRRRLRELSQRLHVRERRLFQQRLLQSGPVPGRLGLRLGGRRMRENHRLRPLPHQVRDLHGGPLLREHHPSVTHPRGAAPRARPFPLPPAAGQLLARRRLSPTKPRGSSRAWATPGFARGLVAIHRAITVWAIAVGAAPCGVHAVKTDHRSAAALGHRRAKPARLGPAVGVHTAASRHAASHLAPQRSRGCANAVRIGTFGIARAQIGRASVAGDLKRAAAGRDRLLETARAALAISAAAAHVHARAAGRDLGYLDGAHAIPAGRYLDARVASAVGGGVAVAGVLGRSCVDAARSPHASRAGSAARCSARPGLSAGAGIPPAPALPPDSPPPVPAPPP